MVAKLTPYDWRNLYQNGGYKSVDKNEVQNVPSPEMTYQTHKDIIDAWPSLANFAAEHGVKYDTAKGWRRRNSIPPRYWPAIVATAGQRNLRHVTFELLSTIKAAVEQPRAS